MLKRILLILSFMILSGCGGGSGGTLSRGGALSGVFVDTHVIGLSYRTSSGITGVTDEHGGYRYNEGDTVTFSLNGISIGSCAASAYVTPMSIFPDNLDAALNLAQFLQSIDSDGDPSNGITPSEEATDALSNVNNFDFENSNFDDLLEANLPNDFDFVDDGVAMRHMEESFAELEINADGSSEVDHTRLFVGGDVSHGLELWKMTDGMIDNASLVKELLGGTVSSYPSSITAVGNRLFFVANDNIHGRELWVSDGTAIGTIMVKDINEGDTSSSLNYMTAVGEKVFFRADDGIHGEELWVSDGTVSGTKMIKDIIEGDSSSNPRNFTTVGDKVFFIADDEIHGIELWVSNGTTEGTTMVKDIYAGTSSGYPQRLIPFNQKLVFMARSAEEGYELWISDGTLGGTHMVKDIANGAESSYPSNFVIDGDSLYFFASHSIDMYRIYKTNGTEEGTISIKDFDMSLPSYLTLFDHKLYFQASEMGVANGKELWVSDGTPNGTTIFKDIYDGSDSSSPKNMTVAGSKMFFTADDGVNGRELWVSNGTVNGTHLVKDIYDGSYSSYPHNITAVGDKIFFEAHNSISGYELWISDGTADGTMMVKDIQNGRFSSHLDEITAVGDKVFFSADDGVYKSELWVSDGTSEGTTMVKDIATVPTSSLNKNTKFIKVEDKYYFNDNTGKLWVSDGSASGTIPLGIEINLENSVVFDNHFVYVVEEEDENGDDIYHIKASDGTVNGVTTILSSTDIDDDSLVVANNKLYFINNNSLYSSNSIIDNTSVFTKLNGLPFTNVSELTSVGERLFFVSYEEGEDVVLAPMPGGGATLYITDGTVAGTRAVIDDETYMDYDNFVDVDGTLFFSSYTSEFGRELWKSDGTTVGTVMVKNIALDEEGSSSSSPEDMTNLDGILYFVANDRVHGEELWRSDGTQHGTVMVKDIREGSSGSRTEILATVDNKLYFKARTDTGDKLFVSYKDTNLTQEVNLSIPDNYEYELDFNLNSKYNTLTQNYSDYLLVWINIYSDTDNNNGEYRMLLKKVIGSTSETLQDIVLFDDFDK